MTKAGKADPPVFPGDAMQKFGALLVADAFEAVMTKLEAFGGYFEQLATTAEQRKLAGEFSAFVAETIQAMTPRIEELEQDLAIETKKLKAEFKEEYGCESWAELFKEIREDEAAGKREGAHPTWRDIYQVMRDNEAKAPAVEKGKEKGIER